MKYLVLLFAFIGLDYGIDPSYITSSWAQDTDRNQSISLGRLQATSAGGLYITDDSGTLGNGIYIKDGGNVAIKGIDIPSWDTSWTALRVAGTGVQYGQTANVVGRSYGMAQNSYFDSVDGRWECDIDDESADYYQNSGTHNWRVAAACGGADTAISWTDAMRIQADGSVSVAKTADTTPPLDVNGDIHATRFIVTSDGDLKKDFSELPKMISSLKTINPKEYRFKTDPKDFSETQKKKLMGLYGYKIEEKEVAAGVFAEVNVPDWGAVATNKGGLHFGFNALDLIGTDLEICTQTVSEYEAEKAIGLDIQCLVSAIWKQNQEQQIEIDAIKLRLEALEKQ